MQGVIFDMDGTLIDSEPMWKEAERHVFTSLGVQVSDELCAQTATMTTRQVTEFWYRNFPWTGKSLEHVENEVVDHVATLIFENGEPMEGVNEILQFFYQKNFKIGLSTNAPYRLIPIVLNKLGIADYFHGIYSSEHEEHGKPHPAVYLSTLKKLNVAPSKCLAFEDSLTGIVSANNAQLKTVAVPPASEFTDKKYEIADLKLRRLSDFSESHLNQIQTSPVGALQKIF
ncbi:hexitol phosphatase HxpB [Thiomicrorhabdus sp. 6S2-11]|uniref:Hexitol phosphatase HxpB n=1 Tax=Thiomicrorhabdus marina TaxID=2818442 RepID=A0ABS3Q5D7_9GAMM|nr:hexitol phosphatase HxpB [Thiomicrorhabdus marina]MBO1927070.1 hexitol phosphatase HxpB [Thiomicrorhabdus marina]